MSRASARQLSLAMPAQRRRARQMADSVYQAICILRYRGYRVWAARRDHQVDGRRLSTAQLLAMAKAARPDAIDQAPAEEARP